MDALQVLESLRTQVLGGGGAPDSLYKAWTTSTGLVNYDLERTAKSMYPVLTPLRNETPRIVTGAGDVATHWKTITAINSNNVPIGLKEGQRGGVMNTTLVDNLATYVTYGLDDYVTYQAQWASEQFDDAVSRATLGLLEATMIQEEFMMLGGNYNVALGTTPTPTATGSATGGAMSDGSYYVGCVALTMTGSRYATVAGGVQQVIVRQNADGTSDVLKGGTAQPSAQSTVVTLNAGTAVQSISANVTAVRGAVAYAWYLSSASSTSTHLYLKSITFINSAKFTTAGVNTFQDFVALSATDNSAEGSFSFNGYLYQTAFTSTSGAYYAALATGTNGVGTALTTDNAAGVNEINTALQYFWDNYRLSPDTIWVNSQEANSINKIVIAGGGAPLYRIVVDSTTGMPIVTGGTGTGGYFNKFTNTRLDIRIHPNMPAGTLMFSSKKVPYPHPDIDAVARMKMRADYFQRQWPQRTLKYEYGVYADGVLQIYWAPAFGVITNIAPS